MNTNDFLSFDKTPENNAVVKETSIIKYTILKTEDWRESHKENRVLDEYQFESTFEELFQFMQDFSVITENKTDGKFIIPVNFVGRELIPIKNGSDQMVIRRSAKNVDKWYMLPVDVDGGMTLDEAREKFKGYRYILYSSYSHRLTGVDKFRMLFELTAPIADSDFVDRKKAIHTWLGDGIDPSSLYRSHGFYLPTFNKHNQDNRILEMNEGKALNLHSFEVEVAEKREYTETDTSDDDKKEILNKLKETCIDSYHMWWQMVEALKGSGFAVGDLIYVSAGNSLHDSDSLPNKTANICTQYWSAQRSSYPNIGKLINIIRISFPDFRKKAKKSTKMEQELALIMENIEKLKGEQS